MPLSPRREPMQTVPTRHQLRSRWWARAICRRGSWRPQLLCGLEGMSRIGVVRAVATRLGSSAGREARPAPSTEINLVSFRFFRCPAKLCDVMTGRLMDHAAVPICTHWRGAAMPAAARQTGSLRKAQLSSSTSSSARRARSPLAAARQAGGTGGRQASPQQCTVSAPNRAGSGSQARTSRPPRRAAGDGAPVDAENPLKGTLPYFRAPRKIPAAGGAAAATGCRRPARPPPAAPRSSSSGSRSARPPPPLSSSTSGSRSARPPPAAPSSFTSGSRSARTPPVPSAQRAHL